MKKGLKAYSLDLITEADQELTDIVGQDMSLLYHFIGEGSDFGLSKLERLISGAGVPPDTPKFHGLLWLSRRQSKQRI